jgi:cytochrome c-type biogenesis protein CcmH
VILLVLTAVLAAAGGALWLARGWPARAAVAGAALAGAAVYWLIGEPGRRDEPFAARIEALEAQARADPERTTVEQALAIAQKRAQDEPADPEPHWFTGRILAASGRPLEARLAYQSALRRDGDYIPALKGLADLTFEEAGGQVTLAAERLYRRAYELDPDDVRAGFMAGLAVWQAGRKAEAEAFWDTLAAGVPEGDPRRGMIEAHRQTFAVEPQPEAAPVP